MLQLESFQSDIYDIKYTYIHTAVNTHCTPSLPEVWLPDILQSFLLPSWQSLAVSRRLLHLVSLCRACHACSSYALRWPLPPSLCPLLCPLLCSSSSCPLLCLVICSGGRSLYSRFARHNWKLEDGHLVEGGSVGIHGGGGGDKGADSLWIPGLTTVVVSYVLPKSENEAGQFWHYPIHYRLYHHNGTKFVELAEVCEVVIELYYQEVWLVLDNIYMRICLVHNHVTDQGLPIQQNLAVWTHELTQNIINSKLQGD